jgi:cell division protein FtsI/penicillin-binding protein 2
MRREYAWRSTVLLILQAAIAVFVLAQIIRIQNSAEAALLRDQAELYSGSWQSFYPERGEIYDRNGHLLAGNEAVYTVGVNVNEVTDAEQLALAVSVNLDVDYYETLNTILNPDGLSFLILKNYVSVDEAEPLVKLQEEMAKNAQTLNQPSPLSGLEFQPTLQRSYPEDSLASSVIGFVTRDGRGYFGVEEKYNSLLAGNPVQVWVPEDPNRAAEIPTVPNGITLVLTLNRDLQAAVEQSLDQALADYGAQNGTAIVMDPRTGEILALATTPRMNLNQFWNYYSIYDHSEYNPAISMLYEPGSVFKILTMAAALDTGTVTPDTVFVDAGYIEVGGVIIQNWDRRGWGPQTMTGCLQHSLNVCLAWVSTSMGEARFYNYLDRFGIGQLTGIDLAGETSGYLRKPGDTLPTGEPNWYPVDLGTNAFGQGVAVSPMQMLMAASSIANDGRMVVPRMLYGMVRDGRQFNVAPTYGGTPISVQTAHTLSGMLAVSLENEASLALVPGYRIAGKTGTAQIPVNGYYDPNSTNVSFIGWGPVDDPKFMIYVWLERPSASTWSNDTAAPLFAEIAQKTVIMLDIPPDAVRLQMMNP